MPDHTCPGLGLGGCTRGCTGVNRHRRVDRSGRRDGEIRDGVAPDGKSGGKCDRPCDGAGVSARRSGGDGRAAGGAGGHADAGGGEGEGAAGGGPTDGDGEGADGRRVGGVAGVGGRDDVGTGCRGEERVACNAVGEGGVGVDDGAVDRDGDAAGGHRCAPGGCGGYGDGNDIGCANRGRGGWSGQRGGGRVGAGAGAAADGPRGEEVIEVDGAQTGGLVIADGRDVVGGLRTGSAVGGSGGALIAAAGDVVEGRGVGGGVGGQGVERGVDDALTGRVALGLIDDRDQAGEGGRVEAGAATHGEVARGGIAQAVIAARFLAGGPESGVAGAEGEGRVGGGGGEGDVGDHAIAAAGGEGDAADGAGLPTGPGSEDAHAAGASGERLGGVFRGEAVIVPDLLGNVGVSRADDVRGGRGREVCIVAGNDVSGRELGAAHAGDVLAAGREVDGELLVVCRFLGAVFAVAVGGAVVASGGNYGLALGRSLLEVGVELVVTGLTQNGFTFAVAGRDDGSDLLVDSVLEGVGDTVVSAVAHVDEVDLSALGDGAGVLQVEIGLGFIAVGGVDF